MHKPSPFRYLLLVIPVVLIVVIALFVRQQFTRMAGISQTEPGLNTPSSQESEPTEGPLVVDPGIQKGIEEAVARLKENDPGYTLYNVKIDNVIYSEDKKTAQVWLAAVDPATGEVLGREPEIAIAMQNPEGQKGTADEWKITLPYESNYDTVVSELPKGIFGKEFEQTYQTKYAEEKTKATFGGYYLPWAGGVKKRLTWSISHASCGGNACKYAFDFADGTMFPILAAKGGSVFAWQVTCSNGSTGCTNYLILKDSSTSPVSYQLYYHMAKNTVPGNLQKVGAVVKKGQFIGNADDTGASTANHLHFMVHTNSYGYWGDSVDITFKDVSINYDSVTKGGRPRLPEEADKYGGTGQYYYISGNSATGLPSGSISAPAEGAVIKTQTLTVTGKGTDDRGIAKVQLLAYYDNTWHEVGTPATTASFTFNLDMCSTATAIPDGPVTLALKVYDVEGNQTTGYVAMRDFIKTFKCGATATVVHTCQPTKDQVSLYSGVDYTGTCQTFSNGDYPKPANMNGLAGSDAASVLVGADAQITMWSGTSYTGRAETLIRSDPDLGDNVIDRDTVNSFRVRSIGNGVAAPVISYPTSSTNLTSDSTVTLYWINGGWTDQFQAVLSGPSGFTTITSEWSKATSWNVGSLPAGTYTLTVRGRNSESAKVSTDTTGTFTVKAASIANTSSITAPWQETFESGVNGWAATGLWNQTTARTVSPSHSWFYGEVLNGAFQYGTGNRGTLTSPAIKIPSTGYYLHFFYRSNTESSSTYWDQRFVQISQDGGPFVNLYQLSSDPAGVWLQSPALDLKAYANHNVRIRFSFDTLDSVLNVGEAWYIDDVLINQNGPETACNEPSSNGTIASASSISLTQPATADICPSGDIDYYKFTAKSGDQLTFDVDAQTVGSALDPVLTLIDTDGSTVLAENDDEVSYSVKDSMIYYVIPADGTYYLKVRAWNHPMVGGRSYFYNLRMYNDVTAPAAAISYPKSGTLVPNGKFNIIVTGDDGTGSGIGHVLFYWHGQNWDPGSWVKIGEDWDGTDGWKILFDPTAEPKGSLGAVYAQVFDKSGNWSGVASFTVKTDPSQTPPPTPTSALIAQPATSALNTVLLQWTASDVGVGIAGFEFQVQTNNGAWQDWTPEGVNAASRTAWFIGELGNTYGFRIRVVDHAGNKEAWTTNAETSVRFNGCTAGLDISENDNNLASAKENIVGGDHLTHTFCGKSDEDWIKFTAQANEMYFINALSTSRADAAVLTLYDSNGNALAESFPAQLGSPTNLRWMAPADGVFYVKARNFNPLIAGDGATYQLWVDVGNRAYVPLITP
jgi:hypothetical protein